jgi:hypothetical protein
MARITAVFVKEHDGLASDQITVQITASRGEVQRTAAKEHISGLRDRRLTE